MNASSQPRKHHLFRSLAAESVVKIRVYDADTTALLGELGANASQAAIVRIARERGVPIAQAVPVLDEDDEYATAAVEVKVPQLPAMPRINPAMSPKAAAAPAAPAGTSEASVAMMQAAMDAQRDAAHGQMEVARETTGALVDAQRVSYEARLAEKERRVYQLEAELHDMRDRSDSRIERLRERHEDELSRERDRCTRRIDELEDRHRRIIDTTELDAKRRIQSLEDELRRSGEDAARRVDGATARLREENEGALSRARTELDAANSMVDSLRSQLRLAGDKAREELETEKRKHGELKVRYERLRDEREADSRELAALLKTVADASDPNARAMLMNIIAAKHDVAVPEEDGLAADSSKMVEMLGGLFKQIMDDRMEQRRAERTGQLPAPAARNTPAAQTTMESESVPSLSSQEV